MKKMFFTAIALVAFSGVSMANTIADEKVMSELIIQNQSDCESYAAAEVADVEDALGCLESDSYNRVYNMYLDFCNSF